MEGLELEDSPHVQHMRKHPDAYCAALADFLARLPSEAGTCGPPRLQVNPSNCLLRACLSRQGSHGIVCPCCRGIACSKTGCVC